MACFTKGSLPSAVKANMQASKEDRLPDLELIGQMKYISANDFSAVCLQLESFSTLLFAAVDTTSGALARILHVLAQHPGAQERLRKEITQSRANGGDLDYNDLMALPYLDSIIRETLRL
jgi:cytochrome P450